MYAIPKQHIIKAKINKWKKIEKCKIEISTLTIQTLPLLTAFTVSLIYFPLFLKNYLMYFYETSCLP